MNANVVNWFEIYVEDMNRAKNFYEKVLDLEMNQLPVPNGVQDMEMYAFPWVQEAPFAAGSLVKSPMGSPSDKGTIVYFNCEDCSLEESRVAEAGGTVVMPKMPIGEHGFIALFKDTEGNTVGLHSRK